jgi:hypothetical protein
MLRSFCKLLVCGAAAIFAMAATCRGAADQNPRQIQEEVWTLPRVHPTIDYVVRPVGPGPFPLAMMNHGVSLDAQQRGFFPLVSRFLEQHE